MTGAELPATFIRLFHAESQSLFTEDEIQLQEPLENAKTAERSSIFGDINKIKASKVTFGGENMKIGTVLTCSFPTETDIQEPIRCKYTNREKRYIVSMVIVRFIQSGIPALDLTAYPRKIAIDFPSEVSIAGLHVTIRFIFALIASIVLTFWMCGCLKDRLLYFRSTSALFVMAFLALISVFWAAFDSIEARMAFMGATMVPKGVWYGEAGLLPSLIIYVVFPTRLTQMRAIDLSALSTGDMFFSVLVYLMCVRGDNFLIETIVVSTCFGSAAFLVVLLVMPKKESGCVSNLMDRRKCKNLKESMVGVGKILLMSPVTFLSLYYFLGSFFFLSILVAANVSLVEQYGLEFGSQLYLYLNCGYNVLSFVTFILLGRFGTTSERNMRLMVTYFNLVPGVLFVFMFPREYLDGELSDGWAEAVSISMLVLAALALVPVRCYALELGTITIVRRGRPDLAINLAFWVNFLDMLARSVTPAVAIYIQARFGLRWHMAGCCAALAAAVALEWLWRFWLLLNARHR